MDDGGMLLCSFQDHKYMLQAMQKARHCGEGVRQGLICRRQHFPPTLSSTFSVISWG